MLRRDWKRHGSIVGILLGLTVVSTVVAAGGGLNAAGATTKGWTIRMSFPMDFREFSAFPASAALSIFPFRRTSSPNSTAIFFIARGSA